MGFEKEDAYFWKQMGKALLCTYTLFGVAWIWNETSPLGWWTLKPRPKVQLLQCPCCILDSCSLVCTARTHNALFGWKHGRSQKLNMIVRKIVTIMRIFAARYDSTSMEVFTTKYANTPCSILQPSFQSFFFSLPYTVMPSGWIREMNVRCACVDVQNSQNEPATDLLLYLAKRHACWQETPSSEQPTGQPQPATDACQSHPQPNVQASICFVHATAKYLPR